MYGFVNVYAVPDEGYSKITRHMKEVGCGS